MSVFVEIHRNLTDIIRILSGIQKHGATHDMEKSNILYEEQETLSSIFCELEIKKLDGVGLFGNIMSFELRVLGIQNYQHHELNSKPISMFSFCSITNIHSNII